MLRDVRVIQRGEDLRFALESREAIGIVGERLRQDLDRDVAIAASCRARDRPRPCRPRRAPRRFRRDPGAYQRRGPGAMACSPSILEAADRGRLRPRRPTSTAIRLHDAKLRRHPSRRPERRGARRAGGPMRPETAPSLAAIARPSRFPFRAGLATKPITASVPFEARNCTVEVRARCTGLHRAGCGRGGDFVQTGSFISLRIAANRGSECSARYGGKWRAQRMKDGSRSSHAERANAIASSRCPAASAVRARCVAET